jgi:hypothetical protein
VEQKALFEVSADRLPYVECFPSGRSGPKAFECMSKEIDSYPTWIIKGKRYKSVLKPDRLAVLSGYPRRK